ncbi:hypothetical protein MTX20_00540 (plasmid) [Bradyrhizobium sp. ISRA435]|nr:hypothetical protein MTX20_00540 [Bradyrhizobium sp. ISRA435]
MKENEPGLQRVRALNMSTALFQQVHAQLYIIDISGIDDASKQRICP